MSVSRLDRILEEAKLKREAKISDLKDKIFKKIFENLDGQSFDTLIKLSKKSDFTILIDGLPMYDAIDKFGKEEYQKKQLQIERKNAEALKGAGRGNGQTQNAIDSIDTPIFPGPMPTDDDE